MHSMSLLIGTDDGLYRVDELPFERGDPEQVLECDVVTAVKSWDHADGIFVASSTGAYRSRDGGETWEDLEVPLGDRFWHAGESEVWSILATGEGALYYSTYLSYFTKEEDIEAAGNEIFIERDYYKLVPRTQSVNLPDSAVSATPPAGRDKPLAQTGHSEDRAVFTRVPLKTGDAVQSGDLIEVVLKITSKNDYDFLAFEDFKPAGCEPLELRSGGRWAGGLVANVELRDEKVVFFIGLLAQGEHVLRYKLRAETPGEFHALPTKGFAMYAPEVKAISDEMRLRVND
ncbi:MAG: hypothetical protein IH986_18475 [Planctomycetes bacterium]|nr:hypothetical protein [Planctomycetota bacterium]